MRSRLPTVVRQSYGRWLGLSLTASVQLFAVGALRPILLLSSDLRQWNRVSEDVPDEPAPPPSDGLESLQFPLHYDSGFPLGLEFFRILAP